MKVLFVAPYAYPHIGGAETHINYLSKELSKLGCKVEILTSLYNKKLPKSENINSVLIKRIPVSHTFYHTPITPNLFDVLMKEDYDIIHVHYSGPYSPELSSFVSLIRDKPMIITHHGIGYGSGLKGFLEKVYYITLWNFVLSTVKKIIIPTSMYLDDLKKHRKKCIVIPNGVDLKEFVKQKSKNKSKEKIVLFVGKLLVYKGLDILLEAMKKVDAKLVIVGHGDETYYKKLVKKMRLDNKVMFLKDLERKKLIEIYKRCDVLVLPSIRKTEVFGIVLIEGMASGKPVIGSRIGGIPEIIKNGKNGLLVPPEDSDSLIDAINYILNNPKKSKKMGSYGQKLCKLKYDWKVIAKKTFEVYNEVMKNT